jgi:acyl-CoA synthetase (AMP-forming)/AMP-acid ligase II
MVQFSSGTTFDPKPVALTHRAVVAQARILNGYWPDTAEVRHSGVSWLPLYHDMGLIGAVFPALERPGVITLLAPEHFVARPASWLRALSRYRATISAAPGFAYRLATEKVRDEELAGVDLGAWSVALAGAEPIVPAVLRRFQERFARWGLRPEALTPVYGLAEASLAVTFCDLDRPFATRRYDRGELSRGRVRLDPDGIELPSLGRPVPGFEVRIATEEGGPPDAARIGHVHVRGPSLMAGYLDLPEATARAFRDGWLDTGDLGFLFAGELYLTGRAKDVVILRGKNHSPLEIEQAVDGVAGVRRGGAVAVSHLPEGADREVLLVFVERAGESDRVDELPRACTEAVLGATGLSVDQVHVLERGALPRTSSGKLRRAETLRRHLAGELSPAVMAPVTA